jgi:hypothetical protein
VTTTSECCSVLIEVPVMLSVVRIVNMSKGLNRRFWCKRQKNRIFGVNTPLEGANPNAEH